MKLFSKKEIDENKNKERDRQIVTGAQLARSVDDLRALLNKEKGEYQKQKEVLSADLVKFSQEIYAKRATLADEVARLEERKAKALEPLEAREGAIAHKEAEIKTKEQDLVLKTAEFAERRVDLILKMDNLDSAKEALEIYAEKLQDREARIKRGEAQQSDSAKQLTKEWEKFQKEVAKQASNLKAKLKEIADRERVLATSEELNKEARKAIEKDRKHLASQQTALKLAFRELKRLESKK